MSVYPYYIKIGFSIAVDDGLADKLGSQWLLR